MCLLLNYKTYSSTTSHSFSFPPLVRSKIPSKETVSLMFCCQGAIHGVETKRCAHICNAFEGAWRHLEFVFFHLSFFFFSLRNWLHKKASCEPSSLNEKHVAGIQNSGVFQHGPGRHLFLVCTAKSWSRERGCGGNGVGRREDGGEKETRRRRGGGGF